MKVSFNCSCGHLEGRFDVLPRKFMQKYDFFSIVVKKRSRKKNSELFPQLVPLDTLDPALSTLQKYIWTKGYVFLAQLPNLITITTSMKKISINASLTCRIKFWQTAEIFSRKRPNFFARSQIFSRSFFPRTLIKSGKLDFIEFPRLEKCWSFSREMQPSIFLTGIVNKNGIQKQAGGR